MQKLIYIGILFLSLLSCKTTYEAYNKKNVSDSEYKESFFTSEKEPKPNVGTKYYWFKSQKVYATQSDYGGALLDGMYAKYYYSNQLAEKGEFNQGKKVGTWKTWDSIGQLVAIRNYKNGLLGGSTVNYDSVGNVLSTGKYKQGKRSGEWVFMKSGDTINYCKGEKVTPKQKDSLSPNIFAKLFKTKESQSEAKETAPNFFQKLFAKKETTAAKKSKATATKKKAVTKKTSKKVDNKKSKTQSAKKAIKKKDNFFQRLFAKKN